MSIEQGNLFEEAKPKPTKPADLARAELTPEAAARRAQDRETTKRRLDERYAKDQADKERALEQDIDKRGPDDFRSANAKYFSNKAREELRRTPPPPGVETD